MRNFSLAFAAALLLGTAAAPALAQGGHAGHAAPAAAAGKPRYGDFGLDLTAMDRSVKPGDSFWHFVNGNWDKSTQIAADRTSAGAGVLLVDEAETPGASDRRGPRQGSDQVGQGRPAGRRLLRHLDGRGRRSRPRAPRP